MMIKISPKTIAVSLITAAFSVQTIAQRRPGDLSGRYGPLTVLVQGDEVTGTFFDHRGMPDKDGYPPFSCIFMLRGKLHGDQARVQTGIPGEAQWTSGTLSFDGDVATLTLTEDQGGCLTTGDSMVAASDSKPWSDSKTDQAGDWLAVTLVKRDRSVLYPQPQETPRKRPYLLQYDPVIVLGRKAGWVRVSYSQADASGNDTPIIGWMKSDALYTPPQP